MFMALPELRLTKLELQFHFQAPEKLQQRRPKSIHSSCGYFSTLVLGNTPKHVCTLNISFFHVLSATTAILSIYSPKIKFLARK